MNSKIIILFILLISFLACQKDVEQKKEPWIEKPREQWPDFSLTNEVSFDSITFSNLANSFLINTGSDTLGVSCKHLFMAFRKHLELNSISLGKEFNYWKLYPKNKPSKSVQIKKLINKNKKEPIGQFNTLKNRDWIIFEIKEKITDLYPLKIRYTPLKKGETIYAVGWGHQQKNNKIPKITKFKCFQNYGNYYYAETITKDINPAGRSGSPVIDKNGYLVGLTSGSVGKLTVIGSIQYLKKLFDQYKIDYTKSIP